MRQDLSPEQYWDEYVKLWRDNAEGNKSINEIGGVQLIGGCCGIGPGHIAVLKERLTKRAEQASMPKAVHNDV